MRLRNAVKLDKFARKHRDAAKWIERWKATVAAANWRDLSEVRIAFPSADGVRVMAAGGVVVVVTVFNVKGNEYRLLTVIDYRNKALFVVDALTHAAYDRNQWKDRL